MRLYLVQILCVCLFALAACSSPEANKIDTPTTIGDEGYITIEPVNFLDFKPAKVVAFATVDPFDYIRVYHEKPIDISQFKDTVNVTLNDEQIAFLNEVLSGKHREPYLPGNSERNIADCFYPRHNILFLGENDSLLHYKTVCFECGNARSSKPDLADMDNMQRFFDSIGLPVFYRPDYYSTHYDSVKASRYEHNLPPLLRYFRYDLDFEEFKFQNRRLLNCGRGIDGLYHPDTAGFEYNYCLFNGNQEPEHRIDSLASSERLMFFTVYNYGDDIGTYSDNCEMLLSYSSKIQNELLYNSDFVGISKKEITQKFGTPAMTKKGADIYVQKDQVLVLSYGNSPSVQWFRYARLNKSFDKSDESLIDQLVTWQ